VSYNAGNVGRENGGWISERLKETSVEFVKLMVSRFSATTSGHSNPHEILRLRKSSITDLQILNT
jgi:hypothetical protein